MITCIDGVVNHALLLLLLLLYHLVQRSLEFVLLPLLVPFLGRFLQLRHLVQLDLPGGFCGHCSVVQGGVAIGARGRGEGEPAC